MIWASTSAFPQLPDLKKTFFLVPGGKTIQTEPDDWDALHYRLDLNFPYDSSAFSGQVSLTAKAVQSHLAGITLNMENLTLDSVYSPERQVTAFYQNNALSLSWQPGFDAGEEFSVTIEYHGAPVEDGFYFYETCAYTMSEPQDARKWFPCRDVPWDKTTAEIVVTVPVGVEVASVGLLQSRQKNPQTGTETFFWKTDLPIATYLICITMSDQYAHWSDWIISEGDSIELPYYVFREDSVKALKDFKCMSDAMDIFSTLFGKYPFEKYGMAAVEPTWFGGMEHQTMTTVNRSWFTGTRSYEFGFVHELAHMWWGDAVTLKDWPDIWLNESFATYAEALYWEILAGKGAYAEKVRDNEERYYRQAEIYDFPVYNPPWEELFNGGIVYSKGAFILHTLRKMVGDEDFFEILNTYYQAHLYGNADTRDFISACETVTGESFDWFFDQWIYGPGYPELIYSFYSVPTHSGAYNAVLEFKQPGKLFQLPLQIRLMHETGYADTLLQINHSDQLFSFVVDFRPDSIIVDPNNHFLIALKEDTATYRIEDEIPVQFTLSANYPNPFNASTTLHYNLPASRTLWDIEIVVYNPLGQEIRKIIHKTSGPGSFRTRWDGKDAGGADVPSGVYIIALKSNQRIEKQKVLLVR